MNCEHIQILLNGLVDQELELQELVMAEGHLQSCASCQAYFQQLTNQRATLQQQVTYHQVPSQLQQRILDSLPAPTQTASVTSVRRSRSWVNNGAIAASFLAVCISAGYIYVQPSTSDRLAEEAIANHVRGLLTNHLTDVASSDQHTVKPWFNGKLDFSPPVKDLTTDGFPLLGGRLDYLDHRPVATLTYRHRLHYISLFILPRDASNRFALHSSLAQNGYHLLTWTDNAMEFWAVSDVNLTQLRKFQQLQQALQTTP